MVPSRKPGQLGKIHQFCEAVKKAINVFLLVK